MTPATRVLVALGAGTVLGVAISLSGSTALNELANCLEPVGATWVNALRMTVIPLVVSAILIGITSLPDPKSMGRIGGRTLSVLLIMLIAAATFATTVGPLVFSRLAIDPAATLALRASASAASGEAIQDAQKVVGLGQWVVGLVPANPIKAAADGAMLQLIVFSVLAGLAITTIAESSRERLMGLVKAVYEAALILVRWVLALAPIGVFAISVPVATRLGVSAAGAVVYYVVAVSAMTITFALLFYLAAWLAGGLSLRTFARACAPAQAVALSSRSSLASLPALLDGSDTELHLPPSVRSFSIPLAVAMFRPAGAIAIPVGVLFMARFYGVTLGAHQLVTIAFMAVLTTFSAPGIPSGAIIVMVPVLLSAGLPVDAVGLLIGVDTIPDIVRTVTNVTGDMAAATIVARFERVEAGPVSIPKSVDGLSPEVSSIGS